MIAEGMLPPQAAEAEEQVLGGLLVDPNETCCLCREAGLTAGDFYSHQDRALVELLLESAGSGAPLDAAQAAGELRRRALVPDLQRIAAATASFSTTGALPGHCRAVREASQARRLQSALLRAERELARPGASLAEIREGLAAAIIETEGAPEDRAGLTTLARSIAEIGFERPPAVIEGLLRQGEILTLNAPAKAGKSWLLHGLCLSVATGREWLRPEWRCAAGPVILVDAELPERELNFRLRTAREALALPESVEENIIKWSLHGRRHGPEGLLGALENAQEAFRRYGPSLIGLDPLVCFIPAGQSENDNSAVNEIFRTLHNVVAACEGSAGTINHHSGKGSQGDKSVIDTGRGASAIAGATSTHATLREHEQEGVFVLEARCRSWVQPDPLTLRFEFPVWHATAHDAEKVRGRPPRRAPAPDEFSDSSFADLLGATPKSKNSLVAQLMTRQNYAKREADQLLLSVIDRHSLFDLPGGQTKNCGLFMAAFGGKGKGFKFWKVLP
jgi:hypothetical protein